MKKLFLPLILLAAIGLPSTGPAQTSASFYVEPSESRLKVVPVLTYRIATLENFLGVKGLSPEVRFFAGVSASAGRATAALAGTALVFSHPIADRVAFEFGLAVRVEASKPVGAGALIGFVYKFGT